MNKIQKILGDCVPHNASPNKESQTSGTADLKAREDLSAPLHHIGGGRHRKGQDQDQVNEQSGQMEIPSAQWEPHTTTIAASGADGQRVPSLIEFSREMLRSRFREMWSANSFSDYREMGRAE
ncbi:hypothetical protein CDAR_180621 [Caerostris darwini]|uniref:Uncharacterized protein n=1 Tax=Caerostris darwini TaxID=1538125 RepID=A0AAV4NJW4_9ARAC|nr:hypothetical protein CDAR_258671 [Caerostris darwini]GIX94717.1 hypothetical protein CDAR_180621 [Caerostris darwini]